MRPQHIVSIMLSLSSSALAKTNDPCPITKDPCPIKSSYVDPCPIHTKGTSDPCPIHTKSEGGILDDRTSSDSTTVPELTCDAKHQVEVYDATGKLLGKSCLPELSPALQCAKVPTDPNGLKCPKSGSHVFSGEKYLDDLEVDSSCQELETGTDTWGCVAKSTDTSNTQQNEGMEASGSPSTTAAFGLVFMSILLTFGC